MSRCTRATAGPPSGAAGRPRSASPAPPRPGVWASVSRTGRGWRARRASQLYVPEGALEAETARIDAPVRVRYADEVGARGKVRHEQPRPARVAAGRRVRAPRRCGRLEDVYEEVEIHVLGAGEGEGEIHVVACRLG